MANNKADYFNLENLKTVLRAIKQKITGFDNHVGNKDNPHSVTLQQVLGGGTGVVPVANGGTGATTAAAARTNLGITAITNTQIDNICV